MNHTRLAELSKVAAVRVQVPEPDYNLNELIMEMYGNTLCVSFTELVRGGIISKPTYDKYVREGKLTLLQRGVTDARPLLPTAPCRNGSVQHTMTHSRMHTRK